MVMTDEEYATIVSHNRDPYGPGFFKFTDEDHGPSNIRFGEALWNMFKPQSVVDFGCGTGGTLSALLAHGATVLGIDGFKACLPFIERKDPNLSQYITIHDLIKPWTAPRTFDLAISIECLEHLPPEAADTAVASIASAAPRAIVTAAPPCGGNSLHINEQPFSYWLEKFSNEGMERDDKETNEICCVMRDLASVYTDSKGKKGCLIPAWLFSSYLGVLRRR